MTTPDLRSDKLLDLLRGYTRRQPWVKDDRVILQELFDAIDGMNGVIHAQREQAQAVALERRREVTSLQRRIDYLEHALVEEKNRGVWSYLKFLASPCR